MCILTENLDLLVPSTSPADSQDFSSPSVCQQKFWHPVHTITITLAFISKLTTYFFTSVIKVHNQALLNDWLTCFICHVGKN